VAGVWKQFVLPIKIEGLPLVDENLRLRAENAYLRSILELNIDINKKNILPSNQYVTRELSLYLAVIKKKSKGKYKKTEKAKENILNWNFYASCLFDKLATDITEIKKSGKTIYLSPIKDLYTNMIESWEISYTATIDAAIKPLLKIKDMVIPEGTYLHSDQGGIYTSKVFQDLLIGNNIIQSMSRRGTPIDNSPMESFFGTMKSELIYNPNIKIVDDKDLIEKINEYIHYYNTERIQKKLDYMTPAEFKAKCLG